MITEQTAFQFSSHRATDQRRVQNVDQSAAVHVRFRRRCAGSSEDLSFVGGIDDAIAVDIA